MYLERERYIQMNNKEKELAELEQQMKTLQLQIQFIKDEQEKILTGSNLSTLSYQDLMQYYVKYSQDWFKYSREEHKDLCLEPEIYTAWKEAYQVFKDKRTVRDEKIKNLIAQLVDGFTDDLVDLETIIQASYTTIMTLYSAHTPFDCEEEKWNGDDMDSWDIRIKKKVLACLRLLQKNDKLVLRNARFIDLRK